MTFAKQTDKVDIYQGRSSQAFSNETPFARTARRAMIHSVAKEKGETRREDKHRSDRTA